MAFPPQVRELQFDPVLEVFQILRELGSRHVFAHPNLPLLLKCFAWCGDYLRQAAGAWGIPVEDHEIGRDTGVRHV